MPRDRSPCLPQTIELYCCPYPCINATWNTLPDKYNVSSDLSDADLVDANGDDVEETGYSTISFKDTVHAIYNSSPAVGDPSNLVKLQNLCDQLSFDWYSWRLESFDFVYNGVVAPKIDGYIDEILWTFTAERYETRVKSRPWDDYTEFYNHCDSADDCPPCFNVYSPNPVAEPTVPCDPVGICLYIQDGILKWKNI